MSFRNVDGRTEMLESEGAQFYSRILVANKNKRQRRYSGKTPGNSARDSIKTSASERWTDLSSLLTILIVALTSIGVIALGIFTAYGAVIGILRGVSNVSSPVIVSSLRLVPSETQAGGD